VSGFRFFVKFGVLEQFFALEQKLIKRDPNAPDSRKYAKYLPIWA
jgi:hypothetical protein